MKFLKVVKVLNKNGWLLDRVNGSHYIYKHPKSDYLAVVPCHGSKDISKRVLDCLREGTGLSFRR